MPLTRRALLNCLMCGTAAHSARGGRLGGASAVGPETEGPRWSQCRRRVPLAAAEKVALHSNQRTKTQTLTVTMARARAAVVAVAAVQAQPRHSSSKRKSVAGGVCSARLLAVVSLPPPAASPRRWREC